MAIKLHHGDCIEYMKGMADNSVELTLTDLPYDEVNRETGGLRVFDKGAADAITFSLEDFCNNIARVSKGSCYIFCGMQQFSHIDSILRNNGMTTRAIVWEKTNPTPINGQYLWLSGVEMCVFGRHAKAKYNGSCRNTVLRFPSGSSKVHKTQKPQALFDELVEISSAEGDTVFDPCLGSGTSGLSAVRFRRSFIGCELNKEYYEYSKKRIELAQEVVDSEIL